MILFHVAMLDFDEPEIRSRAWLPVLALRRSGLAAGIVSGDLPAGRLSGAKCLVLAGEVSAGGLRAAQHAAAAGVPVILDIGSTAALADALGGPHRKVLIDTATLAKAITAGSAQQARHIEESLGAKGLLVVPDAPDIEDGLLGGLLRDPGAALRAIGRWIDSAARDGVARARRGRFPSKGKSILWFGAGRRPSGEGGVAELLLAACDLADLAEEMPVRLEIVGRSPRAARRFLKQLPLPITFYRYAPWRVRERLRKADVCLLPGGGDPKGLGRSQSRERLAAVLGVPVVGGPTSSSLLPALRAALTERSRTSARVRDAGPAAAWRHAIETAQSAPRERASVAIGVQRRLGLLLLLQQFQDIDLVVPVAEAASAQPDMEVRLAVLSKIAVPASRRLLTLCSNGAAIEFWDGADLLGNRIAKERLRADVVVTASEGPGAGARFARAFTEASQATGARALTIQHGLDNGGLTFGPPIGKAVFISDVVLTWGGAHRLTDAASPDVRAKAIPVGCPKRAFRREDFPGFPLAGRPFIAVFENLHWHRYGDDYRRRFVADLAATAEAAPDLQFVLKPHMGGQWSVRGVADTLLPANVEIAHPAAPRWRRFTADAFLAHASAVITTPSTIALDAARYGVPAALATHGIAAANYHPLPRLEQTADWIGFVDQIRHGSYDRAKLDAFFADAALPGDALARILTVIRMTAAGRAPADIRAALHDTPHRLAAL